MAGPSHRPATVVAPSASSNAFVAGWPTYDVAPANVDGNATSSKRMVVPVKPSKLETMIMMLFLAASPGFHGWPVVMVG